MKDRLATNKDWAGKVYWPTVVGAVVWWSRDPGATLATLCTSVMVARVRGRRGRSDMVTLPSGPSTLRIIHLVLTN